MKKISPRLADTVEHTRVVGEWLNSAEKRYSWWFDNPVDWKQPARTLYITGWCVSRCSKAIRGIRARIGRQQFIGNYGIQRKDIAAVLGPISLERVGFAIAVPLRLGKSQVVTEVQEA